MKNFNKAASDAITVTSASGVDPRKAQMGSKLGTVSRMRKELKGDKEKASQRKKKGMGMKAQSKAGRAPKMPETAQKGTRLCGGGKTSKKCGGKMRGGGIMYQTGGTFSPEQKMGMMQMGANLAGQVGTAVLDNRKSKAEEKELAKKNHEDKLKAYQQGSIQSAKSAIQQNKATTTLPPQTAPINNMSANGQAPQQAAPQAPAPGMAAPTAGQMMPGQAAGAVVGGAQTAINGMQQQAPRNYPPRPAAGQMQTQQPKMYKLGGILVKLKK